MAARWCDTKKETAPPSMWAPPGGPYLISVNHPLMRKEYERAKRAFRVPQIYPMGDALRWVWEADMIRRYGELEEMPQHIRFRLRVPPYKELLEGIKKDR